ncbi:hypothetical protein AMECASPLE_021595 [Ameca splendens]|uniref:Uncharacterized protein n=1 Tax=Ameca splendens TaxID=208324 RepID=A0ABV0ZQK1_9TELE
MYDFFFLLQIKKLKGHCAKVFSPLSQYFVEPPFSAITAAGILGYVSTSFAHLVTEIFAHFTLQNSSCSSSILVSSDQSTFFHMFAVFNMASGKQQTGLLVIFFLSQVMSSLFI